jgi:signal transduction histidine kinase
MLRDDDAPGSLSPQPSIAELDTLIDDTRRSGLEVSVAVTGMARPLPAGLDLAAYRILQEALTNVRRHAAASRADVRLTYRPDSLQIEVTDDGHGSVDTGGTSVGHGLIGMRERATLYGGTVFAGTRDEGGFLVQAILPAAS